MNKLKYILSCLLVVFATQTIVPAVQADDTSTSSASYDEVYPGLLPDHPLYFLKAARDNLVGFFKGRPLEKADYALMQADKQFAATHTLISQRNNPELAQTTLILGQQYFEEAIIQTKAAEKEGLNIKEMSVKLQLASKRHTLAMKELKESLNTQDQEKYQEAKSRSEKISALTTALH